MLSVTLIVFVIISILGISYSLYNLFSKHKMYSFVDVLLLVFFILLFIFSLFPQLFEIIEEFVGVNNIIMVLLCIFVIVLFFISYILYQKTEQQRREITVLAQEIAFTNKAFLDMKKNNSSKNGKK